MPWAVSQISDSTMPCELLPSFRQCKPLLRRHSGGKRCRLIWAQDLFLLRHHSFRCAEHKGNFAAGAAHLCSLTPQILQQEALI